MLTKTDKIYSFNFSPVRIAVFLLLFLLLLASARAQTAGKKNLPAWQNYKGVMIGMTADEVRQKLGAPKSEDADGFFYVFSDLENAQVLLDPQKKVRTISVVFEPENPKAPNFTEVFGNSATLESKPDGSIYKMVKYTDAGYWISYNRMAGEKAMIIVMIQKM